MKKAVIAIFHGLGDCINATSIIKPLKAKHPNCEITWVSSKAYLPIVEHNPLIAHTEGIPGNVWAADEQYKNLRKKHGKSLIVPAPYLNSLAQDKTLLGSYKERIKVITGGKNLNFTPEPLLFLTPKEVKDVDDWLEERKIEKFVMLEAIFTSSQSFWGRAHTDEALRICAAKGYTVLMTHREDVNLHEYNKICPTFCLDVGFRYMPAFYNKSSGFIGVSSGITCVVHTHQCRKNIPHLEFVSGEHWCTRHYVKKNKVISFDKKVESVGKLIQERIK
tara:strand:- start:57038 stop:57868 length:831 start_codon:yes stop_codon:yes gene_type:complete